MEFEDQVKNITKVLFGGNDGLASCEKLLKTSEKLNQAQQALVELNGEFDSNLDSTFGDQKLVDSIKRSWNGSSRLTQNASNAILEMAHLRMTHANSFSILATSAKRDRLAMLTVVDLLKQRATRAKKHEVCSVYC